MVFCLEESNKECILYYSTLMMTTLPKTLIQIHLLRPVPGLFKKKHDYNNYMFVYSIQHFLKIKFTVVQNQALLLTPQVDQKIQPRPRERRNQFPQHRLQVDHREGQLQLVVGAKHLI